jgi:hypothetical protein
MFGKDAEQQTRHLGYLSNRAKNHLSLPGPSDLEKKLDEVKKKFKKRSIEIQLGLSEPASHMSPVEYIDEDERDERMQDTRDAIGFRRRTFWKSCCGQVLDRRAIVFFVQVFIGATVMIFCMAKIWSADPLECTGEDTTVYFTLLSTLVGFYIPSPSMTRN